MASAQAISSPAQYEHYIWHEIAGLVNKLLVTYGDAAPVDEPGSGAAPANGDS